MSSKVNEALFDLIQSMSKSEKRYFKLQSSRHTIGGKNNYVILFDFIDKQTHYDEEKLFSHFHGEAFLNKFSITKKRLYDHILTALDSFHLAGSIEAQIDRMLHSADILFKKSLYDQSRRVIRSAEKLAKKHEKHSILIRIYKRQKRLLETNGYLDVDESILNEVSSATNNSLDAIKIYDEIWKVKSCLFTQLSKKGVARCKEDSELFREICAPILRPLDLSHATLETKYLYHHSLSAYYYAISELEHSLNHLKQIIHLFEQDAKMHTIGANNRVSVLTNTIFVCDKLGYYRESLSYLSTLKDFAREVEQDEDLAIKMFSSISSIEMSTLLRKGNFIDAQKKLTEINDGMLLYGNKIIPTRRAFLEFKMAVAYMGSGEFNEALTWVNKILNDSDLDKTEDIVGFTQLLDLLIHIELHHDNLLPYSLKNTQRFFKTRNRLYSFEKVLLNFISKLIRTSDPFEMESLWEKLYVELDAITDEKFQSIALEYFDFKSWAESKMKRKSFDILVKEKYNETIKAAS